MNLKDQYIQEIEKLIEIKYVTKNKCYTGGRKIPQMEGIVVHSIGVAQPSVDVIYNNFNNENLQACVHALMNNERIILTLPYNYRSWGCGSGKNGSYNNTHFQFEICEPKGHTYKGATMIGYDVQKNKEWFNQMYTLLIKFLVFLCDKFNLDADAITDHAEANKRGYASAHADTGHWFKYHGKSIQTVRDDVKAILNNSIIKNTNIEDDLDFMSNQSKFNEMLQQAFEDLGLLEPSNWSQQARDWAEGKEYIKGDQNGNKKYKKPMTREEAVQFFYNILGNK